MIKSHSCLLCLYVFISHWAINALSFQSPNHALQKRQTPAPTPLVDFQVYEPVLTPSGTSDQYGCIYTQTLMSYVFSNSYGAPFVGRPSPSRSNEVRLMIVLRVGEYTPPPCTFNRVTITFTATSSGRQFDRLGLMYLGDIEVWRSELSLPDSCAILSRKTCRRSEMLQGPASRLISNPKRDMLTPKSLSFDRRANGRSRDRLDIRERDGRIQCFVAETSENHLRSGKHSE